MDIVNGLIGKERDRFHPTQKPLNLITEVTQDYSEEGDLVLDLFLGSGSTLIPKYIDVIVERYCEYTGNRNIIKNGEQIVWEKRK